MNIVIIWAVITACHFVGLVLQSLYSIELISMGDGWLTLTKIAVVVAFIYDVTKLLSRKGE